MAYQFKSSLKLASASIGFVAATMCTPASAITMTLPTTNLDANSVFSFNSDVQDIMSNMGMYVTGLGNSKQTSPTAWSFNMPVTEVSLNMNLLPLSLSPVSGKASGSALGIYSEDGGLQLANFSLDFKRNVLSADLITTSGTSKNFDVYNFNVAQGLHLSTSGGLSMQMSLTQMKLTSGAQSAFSQALALPTFAVAILGNLDFGKLDINISPSLRFNVSDKAYTASMVPELPSSGMLALGLFGLALTMRRKMQR
ncbi:MAG: hypothetical protein EPO09_10750 [Aquabacterium sp.]|uniref:hypothetical protein n=1 Tax=Aquabacterium sp. TaxID=1872578 RepID=UPI00121D2D5A|nr:hypothetical protein [Aquabacterium sp.]TAK94029.1 MAG: hypothetical protein EPO09_10750 [Aquabacterium sp.]